MNLRYLILAMISTLLFTFSCESDASVNAIITVNHGNPDLPETFSLGQNYPNPTDGCTDINFNVPIQTHVKLYVTTIEGVLVQNLVDEDKAAGRYSERFLCDPGHKTLGNGDYYYILEADYKNVKLVKKLTILK